MESGSDTIRVRACLAVVEDGRVLLAGHYQTDAGRVQWLIPGGGVEYGEGLQAAACSELAAADLEGIAYHPEGAVRKALGVE